MADDEPGTEIVPTAPIETSTSDASARERDTPGWTKYARLVLAVLSAIPWVGGVIGGGAAFWGEKEQDKTNTVHREWLKEHQARLLALEQTLREMIARIESLGQGAAERAVSDGYLDLVRQGFRTWDEAATEEKRRLVQRLLENAAGPRVTSDDVVRLFLDWIERYHEIHFKVIGHISQHSGATRGEIWAAVGGPQPREDSAEADLFKLLIRDLSTGSVIRQHREIDYLGNHLKKPTRKPPSTTVTSAFDDEDCYELTALGQQFVHYTMNDIVPRFGG